MIFSKKLTRFLRISLLIVFLFVSLKSTFFAMEAAFTVKDQTSNESEVKTITGGTCGLNDDTCCCGTAMNKSCSCCCKKSPILGSNSIELKTVQTDNKFLDAIISGIKCSNVPSDYQPGTLSDYNSTSQTIFSSLIAEADLQLCIKEYQASKPHNTLPYKPPIILV